VFNTILFDLDDTLLENNPEQCLPHYFEALGNYVTPVMDKQLFLQAMMIAVDVMTASEETAVSNHDIFWQSFETTTGRMQASLEPRLQEFYRDVFPQLESYTGNRPVALELMNYCFAKGWKVAIATNPVFPLAAIEERLRWAGVPVTAFDYALVTVFENSSATKPHSAYYQQIVQKIDSKPSGTLMVGNDWELDIEPTAALGMSAYWISDGKTVPPDPNLIVGHGTLDDFFAYIQQQ